MYFQRHPKRGGVGSEDLLADVVNNLESEYLLADVLVNSLGSADLLTDVVNNLGRDNCFGIR